VLLLLLVLMVRFKWIRFVVKEFPTEHQVCLFPVPDLIMEYRHTTGDRQKSFMLIPQYFRQR